MQRDGFTQEEAAVTFNQLPNIKQQNLACRAYELVEQYWERYQPDALESMRDDFEAGHVSLSQLGEDRLGPTVTGSRSHEDVPNEYAREIEYHLLRMLSNNWSKHDLTPEEYTLMHALHHGNPEAVATSLGLSEADTDRIITEYREDSEQWARIREWLTDDPSD